MRPPTALAPVAILAVLAVLTVSFGMPRAAHAKEDLPGTPVVATEDLLVHALESVCNEYTVACPTSKAFVVVDPCPGAAPRVRAWQEAGYVLQAIWITHEHADHVAGLGELAASFDVPIVAHLKARKEIALARSHWEAWGLDAMSETPPVLPDTVVGHGDELTLGVQTWKVLHLPGHSKGSLGYYLEGRVLLVGDVLFRGNVGRTDLDTSDPVVFQRTLSEKLWDLPDTVVVLPGHMGATTIGDERTSNWLFQDAVRAARGEPPIARPWMGIRIDPEHTSGGVAIDTVEKDSPSAKAGLGAGDVLLEFDGVVLRSPQDLLGVIRRHEVGDTVPIQVLTPTGERTLEFTFGARPPR